MIDILRSQAEQLLWHPRIESAPKTLRILARAARFPYALIRDSAQGDLTLRAMSLVYTTLIALVPLLAVSFSVLKGFGMHERVQPLLYKFLEPFGAQGVILTDRIVRFVDNVEGVALGSVGLALLLYTVITMIQKVEESFNFVWQVKRARSIGRRFSEYLSVILIAPVLMASAIGLKGAIESDKFAKRVLDIDLVSRGMIVLGEWTPYVLVMIAFSFVYGFIPNTRVQLRAAIVGGVTGGLLWSLSGAVFASFVSGASRYEAIYTTFAIPLLALIWLYVSWLILLLGARISYYYQHPEYLRRGRERVRLTNRLRERLALASMFLIGAEFRHERPHWTINSLATRLRVPADTLAEVVEQLEGDGLLTQNDDEVLMPTRDTDNIALADIIAAVRGRLGEGNPRLRAASIVRVDEVITDIETVVGSHLEGVSLRDLIDVPPPTPVSRADSG